MAKAWVRIVNAIRMRLDHGGQRIEDDAAGTYALVHVARPRQL